MKFFGVTLGLKNAQFKSGLNEARNEVKKFKADAESGGGLMGGLIGKAGAALAAFATIDLFKTKILDGAGAIRDQSDEIGMNVEALQKMQESFAGTNADAEKVTRGMGELSKSMSEAINGNDATTDSFRRLGVSVDDLIKNAERPEEVVFQLADGFKNAADKGQALADIQVLMGKAGKSMAAAMRSGGTELRETFNGVNAVSEESINFLDNMGDKIEETGRKAIRMGQDIVAGLAGQGPRMTLNDAGQWVYGDPSKKAEKKAEIDNAAQRRKEKADNDAEIRDRIAAEKQAEAEITSNKKEQAAKENAAAGISSATRGASLRSRIAGLAPLAIGTGAAAAANRAELAGLLAERGQNLIARELMSPDQRRAADRQARREAAAARRVFGRGLTEDEAKRGIRRDRGALEREFGRDIVRGARGTEKDQAAEAVKVANGILLAIQNEVSRLGTIK